MLIGAFYRPPDKADDTYLNNMKEEYIPGADPGFQVRGAHLKKLRRAEGGAKIFGVFRVKNQILRQKIIFFQC